MSPLTNYREHIGRARWVELQEGETLEGVVVRLPAAGEYAGTRLFVATDDGETVSIAAAARRGWTVLERALKDRDVQAGDRITVTFDGWRQSVETERRYRNVHVAVIARAA